MRLKVSSGKWLPFCLGLNVLISLFQEEEEEVSILDKDPAGTAMLKLLDRGPVSEGLRDKDPMAESPDQTEPPPFAGTS